MSLAERIANLPPQEATKWLQPTYAFVFTYIVTQKFGPLSHSETFTGLTEQALFNCVKRFTTASSLSEVMTGEEEVLGAAEIEPLKYFITDTIDKWETVQQEVEKLARNVDPTAPEATRSQVIEQITTLIDQAGARGISGQLWGMVLYLGNLLPRR
jgi:hypothetical protein